MAVAVAVLAHLLKRKPQPRDILRMMADPSRIEAAVTGTPLAALLDSGAPAQRAGVLASLNMVADSLELLPEWDYTRATFATAEWYTARKRWVFLTSSSAYRTKILPLHSVWLDLFILRMMGFCEDQTAKPVWFVLDELARLNKLPQLHTAFRKIASTAIPLYWAFRDVASLINATARMPRPCFRSPRPSCFSRLPSHAPRSGSPMPSERSRSNG